MGCGEGFGVLRPGNVWGLADAWRLGAKSRRVGSAAGCRFGFSALVRAPGTLIAWLDAAVGCHGAGLGGLLAQGLTFPICKMGSATPHHLRSPRQRFAPQPPRPRASVSPCAPQPIRSSWAWGIPQLALALIRTTGNTQRGGSEPHMGGGGAGEPTAPLTAPTEREGAGARGQHGAPPLSP